MKFLTSLLFFGLLLLPVLGIRYTASTSSPDAGIATTPDSATPLATERLVQPLTEDAELLAAPEKQLLAHTPATEQEAEAEGISFKIGSGPWIKTEGLAYTPMEGIFIIAGGDTETGSISLTWTGGQGRFPWNWDREGDKDIAFKYYLPSLDWVYTGLLPDSAHTFADTRGALVITEFGEETDELISGTFFLYPATRFAVEDEKPSGSSPIEGRFRVRRAN